MRVFVTGATGWVGSAVVDELIGAGHQVVGLSRSKDKAGALQASGAEVVEGVVGDLDLLKAQADGADAVVHTAFNHDFSRFAANAEEDRRAIEALGSALQGSDRPLLATSGFAMLDGPRPATEEARPPAPSGVFPRASETATEAQAARGVRAGVVRLSPSVHGPGDHGFIPILIGIAREKGVSAYIGDGQNRWAGVHRLDAAKVYRLALEKGVPLPRYHAAAEEGVPFREIAEAIGRGLGVPVESRSPEAAQDHFGWFAAFAGLDMSASSKRTRELLDWTPSQSGLIEDIENAGYFG